jgi:hypothetical protein
MSKKIHFLFLYLIFCLSSLTLYLIFLMKKTRVHVFLKQIYENVCLNNLLVRQLKHRDFILNALNFLNE